MDKNSIWGLVIIGAILIGYTYLTKPSAEEIKAKQTRDSIAKVEQARDLQLENEKLSALKAIEAEKQKDPEHLQETFGVFSSAAAQKEEFITLENKLVKIKVSNKGGRIYSVQLKDYQTHDSLPLILWEGDKNRFGMTFYAQNKAIDTQDLYFTNEEGIENIDASSQQKTLSMKLSAGDDQYLEYVYTLAPDSYMLDFDIKAIGLNNIISRNQSTLTFNWQADLYGKEKGRKNEDMYTALYYKFHEDDVDDLGISGEKEEDLTTQVKWIAFKQQFFTSALIAKNTFKGVKLKSVDMGEHSPILKNFSAEISLPYSGDVKESYPMQFYFGPNHYKTLRKYGKDIQLEKVINLGWGIFGWVNKYLVIEVFNFLEKYMSNYGLIILLLTIFIKLILSPLTYKSYLSSAKMRVLKPQIDEINERIPKDKAMERQQATMALYKKVGVSPMGGCLPMLVQMPILFAMFRFFPSSIELRQKSFLWASDLSSYDSIAQLPWHIPMYGDHISLFCILMAITNLVYTKMNGQMQTSTQMPGMQAMMYLMPVMFLVWFNNYAAGLSYYYFIATLFTVVQTWAIRKWMVDDEKVLAMLEASKKKPVKKSKFQQRLEDAAKQANQRKK
ncbi:YidC/Oxa1 family membrane protein insertase [Ancylomarina subtilis]|uniref:Membrane protein insertase YidC n=1 Tax=Ancylomarina subtilis TaxID=1639035 RepID=A0A4Q7VKA2_9BACT|nr:membrane protein insertase YidC [Ancylomarina subtilis]RZT96671.1 YidC/Oxa1 family membrane protein insertase [Ancylomarina subtilis]